MMMYADATGGLAIKNTNAPWEPVPDVFAESRSDQRAWHSPLRP